MLWSVIVFAVLHGLHRATCESDAQNSLLRSRIQKETEENDFFTDYTEAAMNDRITSLPGLDFDLNFTQFSGYLTVSEATNRSIFYWYVESQSNPSTDPVVFWTNGGPGCSGLLAFGTEHGPFFYSKNGTLSMNPYSWNKVANVLYVEQPAGVGFSYSDDESDYITGDAQAAADNYVLIKQFFERFPERKSNQFYISSESYGGHYIPELTFQILQENTDASINFSGFLVGNPYVDPFSNDITMYEAFYSHGLVSNLVYGPWHEQCTHKDNFHFLTCFKYEREMLSEMEPDINPYGLDFPVCPLHHQHQGHQLLKYAGKFDDINREDIETPSSTKESRRRLDYKPCEGYYFHTYLNRKDVRESIHVKENSPEWNFCSSILQYSRRDVNKSLIDFYKKVVMLGLAHDLNMMVFSGDDDSICSLAGTQYWIYDLGLDVMEGKLWNHWYVNEQVAGYSTAFETIGGNGNFTFVTVHGAGHEVPSFKPEQALEMFKIFLKKEW